MKETSLSLCTTIISSVVLFLFSSAASSVPEPVVRGSESIGALSVCGDGIVDFTVGERCDAGGEDASCNANCQVSVCGDGIVNAAAGEICEPGLSTGSCSADCVPVMCGDGIVGGGEQCDDGDDNSDTEPGACRTDCTMPVCGDGVRDPGEDADPPVSPSQAVPINPTTCQYDFSEISQLSCNSACGTPWNGFSGCQQEDADALCKLITGNPLSTAVSGTVTSALAAPGICCPPPTADPGTQGCVALDNMESRGVDVMISVHDTDLSSTHGTGAVVTLNPENCTNP